MGTFGKATSRVGYPEVSSGHTNSKICTKWGPQTIAKLVNITPITMEFMILITIVTGVYRPTNITGGPHIATINH